MRLILAISCKGLSAIARPVVVQFGIGTTNPRHPRRDVNRGFGRRRQRQVGGGDRRHVDMQVDAVEQRPGNLRLVLDGAFGRPAAGLGRVVEIAATA